MKLRTLLGIILISTIAAWAVWFFVLSFVNPFTSGFIGLVFFYWSLSIAIIGTVLLLGMYVRIMWKRRRIQEHAFFDSLRQGIMAAATVFLLLVFMSQGLLTWWNFLVLLVGLSFLELFFAVSQKKIIEQKFASRRQDPS